jgi:hypothetical protein
LKNVNASELLLEALARHNIHLSLLVADTGLWVNPEFHARLLRDTGSAAVFPKVRRARIGQGEKRGEVVDGIRFDDNTYANVAIKRAAGLGRSAIGFEACHIWPLTCYDERHHTAIANLVLLPRALAGLSDHDAEIQQALQYRAFELYEWHPEDTPEPTKPAFYPEIWRGPESDVQVVKHAVSRSIERAESAPVGNDATSQERHRELRDRLANWSLKPQLNVHKIIALVVHSNGDLERADLERRIAEVTTSKNPYGAIASLLTDSGNAYGRVLVENKKRIRIAPEFEVQVRLLHWSI